jgi:hypothetical protein
VVTVYAFCNTFQLLTFIRNSEKGRKELVYVTVEELQQLANGKRCLFEQIVGLPEKIK